MRLNFKNSILDLTEPKIMGILNITPDSFSDGGRFLSVENALKHAEKMTKSGADVIDIGGESTRPGAKKVSSDEELNRVLPVILAIKNNIDIPISIDTRNAKVMTEAVSAGADMVNDISALSGKNSLKTMADLQIPVCLMHMQGEPKTMQDQPQYQSVIDTILVFLTTRINCAVAAGINRHNILIDLGFGFGKTLAHNIELLQNLSRFKILDCPILVGISRKQMIDDMLNLTNPNDRMVGSLIAHSFAIQNGAKIIRTHDVLATKQMLLVNKKLRKNYNFG